MTARIGKALSFSNVIACLALFIALGGTVYAAGKINGKQIKASSLPGNRIKPRTITGSRIKAKTLTGRQVKKHSLTGNEINQGTLTGISAAALANVQYQVTTVPLARNSSDGTTATVGCPPDTYVDRRRGDRERRRTCLRQRQRAQAPSRPVGRRPASCGSGSAATMTVTAVCVAVKKPGSTANSGTGSSPHPFPIYE